MFLKSVQVTQYKSVLDSGSVTLDRGVTCLVGKNESGKTAFLEALYRLNPLSMGHISEFDGLRDYPRRTYSRKRQEVPGTVAIKATFTLEEDDVGILEDVIGEGPLTSTEIQVSRNYENELLWQVPIDEQKLVACLVARAGVDTKLADGVSSLEDLKMRLASDDDPPEAIRSFKEELADRDYLEEVCVLLEKRLPRFLYFDEYSIMPGRVSIPKLQQAQEQLSPGERTALSLLRLAGVQAAEFSEQRYEARKAALEAAANQLSDDVFEYWSQNKDLSIELDVDFKSPKGEQGDPPFLDIRVRNERHRVTLNFGERSHGFMWFFSFLAAFSEYSQKEHIVLLLDEPGLGLHAAAQGDLLRFIDQRLGTRHQVVYTTHSPFMISATELGRVRTVEDVDEKGTIVTDDVLSAAGDTLFPLQAALGYDLAQTLFLAPNNLIVEGPADYLYLEIMSRHLISRRRTGLDSRWVIVPVGGLDKIPTFVALLGAQLNVAVVFDVAAGSTQKVQSLVQRGIIASEKLIPLNEVTGSREADIEDLFDTDFYLDLLERSGTAAVREDQFQSDGRIVKRIEAAIGRKFDHYQPARYLLENQVELLCNLPDATLDRFEDLFMRTNGLLEATSGL